MTQLSTILPKSLTFPPPRYRQPVTVHPELQLLSLLIAGIKLYHPFDPQGRIYASSEAELGYLTVDWSSWTVAQQDHDTAVKGAHGNPAFISGVQIHTTPADVFTMSDAKLDSYLDWYAATWLSEKPPHPGRPRGHMRDDILDQFPTARRLQHAAPVLPEPAAVEDALRDADSKRYATVQNALQPRGIISAERAEQAEAGGKRVPRAGAEYVHYRRVADLDGVARDFHERAAELAAVGLDTLLMAVYRVERRLLVWRARRNRENEMDIDEMEGESGEMQSEKVKGKAKGKERAL